MISHSMHAHTCTLLVTTFIPWNIKSSRGFYVFTWFCNIETRAVEEDKELY